eukprot:gene24153-biopygen5891
MKRNAAPQAPWTQKHQKWEVVARNQRNLHSYQYIVEIDPTVPYRAVPYCFIPRGPARFCFRRTRQGNCTTGEDLGGGGAHPNGAAGAGKKFGAVLAVQLVLNIFYCTGWASEVCAGHVFARNDPPLNGLVTPPRRGANVCTVCVHVSRERILAGGAIALPCAAKTEPGRAARYETVRYSAVRYSRINLDDVLVAV